MEEPFVEFTFPGILGQDIKIAGLEGKWDEPKPLHFDPQHEHFHLRCSLPCGTHMFKYIVDGQWVINEHFPKCRDESGNENNYVDVSTIFPEEAAGLGDIETPVTTAPPPQRQPTEEYRTWICTAPGHFEPRRQSKEPLGPNMLDVKLTHTGICEEDICLSGKYSRIAPGHQGIGIVRQVGHHVHQFHVGQRVAITWSCGACGHCSACRAGHPDGCYVGLSVTQGKPWCFAESVQIHEAFALSIPVGLDSPCVAPLLCQGLMAYATLKHYIKFPGATIGISKFDSLGKMIAQMAAKMGCCVCLLNCPCEMDTEARALGISHLRCTPRQKFDLLFIEMIPTQGSPPLSEFQGHLCSLAQCGTLIPVGPPVHSVGDTDPVLTVSIKEMMFRGITLGCVQYGDKNTMAEMLHFCRIHQIQPRVKVMPMTQINEAVEKFHAMKGEGGPCPIVLQL